ncbi:MAG TPA: hypothetical protein PKC49_14965, partial [Phycisphaerae bacterium]|nr:hypothetical protein [Phycisphaerae bacterium]
TARRGADRPRRLHAVFDACVFRQEPARNYHLVARAVTPGDVEDAPPIEELLEVHVYWRPKASKTHDDPSQTSAVLRYVVRSGDAVAAYVGTGFVYVTRPWPARTLHAQIERAQWRLATRSGEPLTDLDPATLTGLLIAAEDPARTAALQQAVRLACGSGAAALPAAGR